MEQRRIENLNVLPKKGFYFMENTLTFVKRRPKPTHIIRFDCIIVDYTIKSINRRRIL